MYLTGKQNTNRKKLKIERKTHRKKRRNPVARPKELSFFSKMKEMKLEIGIKTLNQKPFVFKKPPKN
jgi:hypothetical protein